MQKLLSAQGSLSCVNGTGIANNMLNKKKKKKPQPLAAYEFAWTNQQLHRTRK